VDIRDLSNAAPDTIATLGHLFDDAAVPTASRRFGDDPNHHLLVAFVEDTPAGFISGVEMTHPDKGTEMFVYELGVDEPFRRRRIGTALVEALVAKARSLGCFGMWVATDADNEAALGTYRAGGSGEPEHQVVLTWTFDTSAGPDGAANLHT
jgi:ribosomal protein S18 acetylase RimI-like enzyme